MEFAKNLQSFLQSCNKSLINQTCSGPYWENIGPWSFLYGPRCARSVLSRPRADILPVRPSLLVNKIYVTCLTSLLTFSVGQDFFCRKHHRQHNNYTSTNTDISTVSNGNRKYSKYALNFFFYLLKERKHLKINTS